MLRPRFHLRRLGPATALLFLLGAIAISTLTDVSARTRPATAPGAAAVTVIAVGSRTATTSQPGTTLKVWPGRTGIAGGWATLPFSAASGAHDVACPGTQPCGP